MIEPRDIALPRPPQPPEPYTFPVLATLAPVVASLALWFFTRSPFALMFAVLGPLVALGSLVDARVQGRRRLRRELRRFEADVAATSQRILVEHDRLRDGLRRSLRAASSLLPAALHDAERWRLATGDVPVVLGFGERASGIRVTGESPGLTAGPQHARVERGRLRRRRDRARDPNDEGKLALASLREEAARLQGAPVSVDARLGIGICGSRVPALAVARAVAVQLADSLPPSHFELRGGFEAWHRALPHFVASDDHDGLRLDFLGSSERPGDAPIRVPVVVADSIEQLPRECRVGVEVSGGELRMLRHPQLGVSNADGVPLVPRSLRADFVSAVDAARFAATLMAAAVEEGLSVGGGAVPDSVELAALWEAATATATSTPGTGRGSLAATFLMGATGGVTIDLVADGPHAVVGGTTGSGKSELLIGWILSMARHRSPEEVTFLLVDFKGGSSFVDVDALPHSVGLLTDLDHAAAERALQSLRAEVRHREHVLARTGARSIDELAPGVGLPRLVVVVDEFAAMVADFPELQPVFADIAARGRSLGVHLILCTQRPGGVVRDAIMANCALRLSLRVNNSQDSVAVIGTDAAASLPRHPVGRCLVSVAGGDPVLTQVALASQDLVRSLSEQWVGAARPRRPWLPPLPARILWADVAMRQGATTSTGLAIPFGLADLPEEQRQPIAEWRPAEHGNLLVLGGRGSGKSAALAALAAGARESGLRVVRIGSDVEAAWDQLSALRDGAADHRGEGDRVLVIDDLDGLVARFPDSHAAAFLELVAMALRDGSATGTHCAVAAQRLTSAIQSLAPLFDSRLLLRLPSRQEHVMAGGDGADHDGSAPAGRGRWRGAQVQLALAPSAQATRPSRTRAPCELGEVGGVAAVITTRRSAIARLARAAGRALCSPQEAAALWAQGKHPLALGDPAEWQAAWSAFPSARVKGTVLFDRCTVSEFRLVSGQALLPPPLSARPGGAWALDSDGTTGRVQLREPPLVDKVND
ncbi:cell division protein [Salinibacterium sp. dk2585]|uniref:FtsK/SpoIIIE domain-containing protein n=1 Tax=unclassified Salinibacterium TaxID=2632331 RepID=UPI0011C25653|nr:MULTISPECIES: FtsK/SpoIIIE domain-containing protein [unclassified Salinibacterium]QEE61724.1 cell division protein [Salinibacterium sp. dk2585]TXK54721.1 cell division protein [Salinibacterium sp. dk5596]